MLVSWNTTNRCNLNCRHCYREAGEKAGNELTTSEGKTLLNQIKEAGFKLIIFSGGEPLLRPDIFELTQYAAQIGLRPVFGTSGTTISISCARSLKEAGAAAMGISLDSIDPSKHNAFRGYSEAWEKAVEGMKNCRKVGLPFQIHTTVMEWNYDEVEDITDFAVKIGARAHHIFFMVPTGRAKTIEEESLREKQYEELLVRILNKQKQVNIELKPTCAPQFMRIAHEMGIDVKYSRGCLAGTAYCCVTPEGDVNPCPYLPIKVGNIREKSFAEIWKEAAVFKELRSMNIKGSCGKCSYKNVCSGCRARAYYYYDDYMAEEPWCLYRRGMEIGR